jgi:hypothetical protein
MIGRIIEVISYIITAAATAVLAWYVYVQTKALSAEKSRKRDSLEAIAKRHGMLVRRSLRECVRALDENDPAKGDGNWANAVARGSAALGGSVQADLHKMLDAGLEARGTTPNLQNALDRYYSAADSFNELSAGGPHMPGGVLTKHRDNARKSSIVCWQAIEQEFGFAPQQPHSFGQHADVQ